MIARRAIKSFGRTSSRRRLGQPRLIIIKVALACWCKTTTSLPWYGPQVTVLVKDQVSTPEPSPRPTPKPEVLFKRQIPGPDTCGFKNGDPGNPFTYATRSETCVTDRELGAFACCSTATRGPLSGNFTDCRFHTSCVEDALYPSNSTLAINLLVRTCVSSSPFCQEFDLIGLGPASDNSGGTGVLKNFECGSTPLTQWAESSLITPNSSSTFPTVVSTSSSSATAATVTTAATAKYFSSGTEAGLLVVSLFCLIIVSFAFSWKHSKVFRSLIESIKVNRSSDRDELEKCTTAVTHSKGANAKALECGSNLYKSKLKSLTSSEIDRWKGFLSLYGRQGVWLRELLMLVYTIYSPVASFCEYRHWDDSGFLELVDRPESATNFLVLLKDASSIVELAALEQTFVSLKLIAVKSSPSDTEPGSWNPNDQLWLTRSEDPFGEIDNIMLCRDLLALYAQIPDRDVHLLAERYRELFYHHAHVAIVYMFRMVQTNVLVVPFQDAFFDVTVQVLSQRYQEEDEKIVEYIRGSLPHTLGVSQESEVFRTSFHNSQFHYRQAMLLLADLKMIGPQTDAREVRSVLSLLQRKTEYLQITILRRDEFGHKVWGMIGYALAELMDVVETTRDQETADKIVQLMEGWCDTAMKSRTPIEMAALCSVLVRLRAFDELQEMPQEHHLSRGYYLARTGFQQLAPHLILSGIHYCAQELPGAPIWRYYLEFWTVAINQGHWDKAESWLLPSYQDLWQRNHNLPGGGLDMWKYSGELEEFTLNVTTLISDCYAAGGHFLEAETMLAIAIRNTFPSQNETMEITRIALWSRLLNVQLELRNLARASIVAFTLCSELRQLAASVLGSQTACWVIREVLVCTNELIREDMHSRAYHILYLLRQPVFSADSNHCAFVDRLPEDLIALIHQRWKDIESAFDPDDTIDEQHYRVFDMLEPVGFLTGTLKDLHAIVAVLYRDKPTSTLGLISAINLLPSNLRNNVQLRKDVVSTEVLQRLSEKSFLLYRAVPAMDNAPVKAVNSPSILEVARHIVRDHPYKFPAPAIRAEGISPHISETPAAKVSPFSSLTRVKSEQQMLKIRKLRRALNLRRHYKNLSTLLKLPKPPESFHNSLNQLEKGEQKKHRPTLAPTGPQPATELQDWVSTPYTSFPEVGSSPIPAMELPHGSDTPYTSHAAVETIPIPA